MNKKFTLFGIIFLTILSFTAFSQNIVTIGTGTNVNSSTDYPAPYGNWYTGDKEQMLITAAELSAAGVSGGVITALAFNVATANGAPLTGFTIKMGNTSVYSLTTTFITGLTTVYAPGTYTETAGWNTHTFTTPFTWDGVSNLVIETCFDKYSGGSNYTYNAIMYNSTTTFNSTLDYRSDAGGVCPYTTGTTYTTRPNMKLTFQPNLANDLAMMEWVSPLSGAAPSATMPIKVKVTNVGTAAQDTFNLMYSVNSGNTIISETYNGHLAVGDTLLYTFTTTANMSASGNYQSGAVVKNFGDSAAYNDTAFADLWIGNPLNGTYTIGHDSSSNFHSFNDATTALAYFGVNGAVTFLVDSGVYYESVKIPSVMGASSTNTITFTSASGNVNEVILMYYANSPDDNYTLKLDGADYIHIKNMTIQANGYNFSKVVELAYGCNYNLFYGNKLVSIGSSYNVIDNDYNNDNYNTYKVNYIIGGSIGINVQGNYQYNLEKGTIIDSNYITGFSSMGIKASNQDSIIISNNYVNQTNSNNYIFGIYTNYIFNKFKIINNRIKLNTSYTGHGLTLDYANDYYTNQLAGVGLVANNMVKVSGYSFDNQGLISNYAHNIKYYHNSVLIDNGGLAMNVFASVSNANSPTFVNNIFANTGGGLAAYFHDTTMIGVVNYNDYYVTGANLAYLNGNLATLADLKSATGQDANSVSINPNFNDGQFLNVSSIALNNKGTHLTEVPYDIDGELRSITTPDIGADEYTPLAHNLALKNIGSANYVSECNMSDIILMAQVINFGTSTETSIPISFKLDNNTTVTETYNGQLLSLDTLNYTFTTHLIVPQAGAHHILVFTDLSTDQYRQNDSINDNFANYQVIDTLPFFENFESGVNKYFHLYSHGNNEVSVNNHSGNNSAYSLYMGGSDYQGWNYYGPDLDSVISNNYSHGAEAFTCDFSTANISSLKLSFDLKQRNSGNTNNSWFYVVINDSIIAKSITGDSVWHQSNDNQSEYENLTFNLSQYTGGMMKIKFMGYFLYDGQNGGGDYAKIDNIKVYQPVPNDVGVIGIMSLSQTKCGAVDDTIYLSVRNYGTQAQSNIPATLHLIYGSDTINWSGVVNSTVQPDQIGYAYVGPFNTTNNGFVNLTAYTSLSNDGIHNNDTLHLTEYNEVYKVINYVDNFDSSSNNWNMNGFYVQNAGPYGLASNALVFESYNNYNYEQSPPINPYSFNKYAIYNKNIGIISPNSYLVFDYKILTGTNFSDSISFSLASNCSSDFAKVHTITPSNMIYSNIWHKVAVPLGNFTGDKVEIGINVYENQNSNYVIGFDNVGIVNATSFSLGNDTAVCYGNHVTLATGLSAANGYNFQWGGPGATPSNNQSTFVANFTGYYWANVTDAQGLTYRDSIHVTIYPQISGSFSTSKNTICNGDSTLINLNLSGALPIAFKWSNGSTTYNDTANTLQSSKYFNPTQNTNYHLISMVDNHGCSDSINSNLMITVNPLPTVNFTGLASQYCFKDSADNLIGTPVGGIFQGAEMTSNIFSPALAGAGIHAIIYKYTNANSCKNSDTISTVVYNNPVVSIVSNIDSTYCSNHSSLTIFAYPNGGIFSGSNGLVGSTFNPSLATIGSNKIIYSVTDAHNCFNSDTAITLVNSLPSVSISTVLNNTYCSNSPSVALSATPSGGIFTGSGVTGNIFNPATANSGSNQIIYSYTDANSCSNKDTVNTTVYQSPNVQITSQLSAGYCANSLPINLTAYPTGGTFTGNGVLGNTFNPANANIGNNTIKYSYTNANGCSSADSVSTIVYALPTVTLSSIADVCGTTSQISLSGGLPVGGVYTGANVNSALSKYYPSQAGQGIHAIYYSYTDGNGCTNVDTNTLKVIGQPSATFSTAAAVCKSDTAVISFTGTASSAATYNWNFDNATIISGTGFGPYSLKWDTAGIKPLSLTVTDSACSSSPYYSYINVLDAIAVVSSVGNATACYADSVTLFANSGPGYTFQWYDTTGTLTNSSNNLPYFSALQTGVYYAKVTNNYGCEAISNQIGVEIYPQLTSNFTIPTQGCKGDIISMNYLGTADTTAQYTWTFDGGIIASGSGSGPYGIIWNSNGLKNVSLKVQKNSCSSDLTSKTINVVSTPAIITALGATTFCDGGSVTLYANSGTNLSYLWYKNGQSLGITTALYTATQSGIYTVQVNNLTTGCQSISNAVTVTVNTTNFGIAFTANQTTFTIPPFNVNISNQTADTSSYYWAWSMGDGSTYTVANPSHHYSYDGNYEVGVVAQNINTGCFDTLIKSNYIHCSGGTSNPCLLTATITPAGPKTICPGDSILLTAANNVGANYQWLKDGILISGQTTKTFWAKLTGNYQIMVSDTSCSKFSNPFSLSMFTTLTPVISSNGSITPCTNDSMELYVTSTFNSYHWSNGQTTSNIFVKNSSNYTVTTTDINLCKTTSQPYVVNASLLSVPEICIVGVDSATNHNYIVWQRQSNSLIDSFRIYRESTVAGVYYKIGTTSINSSGIFYDINSNPIVKAYRYKITAIDTCGMETPPSDFHKTIHLNINAGLNGTWNLIWDHYVGFNFGSYRIFRGSDSTALQPLTQIQSTLNSYTDLTPPAGKVYYQIEAVAPHPCYPDSIFAKANTNYNTSRSNNVNTGMASNIGINEKMITNFAVNIYPIPNKGQFTMELVSNSKDEYQIRIVNILGKEIYKVDNLKVNDRLVQQLNLLNPAKGVYYIIVENKTERMVKKLIVN
ncbi:MAG: hypothetical protein AUJ98_03120 [Bacteroidetes bacterium CG2_30_33_31]|nr:MAG: hypothetical protein AUJ98_03120 [Bacteroidetes bacterium CG2_30_33_31]